MIHIDSKITIWDRFSIDDEHKEELMEFLRQNPDATANDIIDWASDNAIDGEHSTITDTGEPMTPDENDGQSTVEVIQSSPEGTQPLWDNTPAVKLAVPTDISALICDLAESASDEGCDHGIAVVDSERINALMEAIGKEPPFPKAD